MIEFAGVSKIYPNRVTALQGVSFRIENGEFAFLVGPSGAGKSTIIKLMTCEERATSGQVVVVGKILSKLKNSDVPYLRRQMGVVFQDFRLLPNKTVYENVSFAMQVIEAHPREIKQRVPEVLELVGLSHKHRAYPHQLSGGEQQRISLARALVNEPHVLICDEPTGNLDPDTSWEIMNIIMDVNRGGTTILMATHAKNIVDQLRKRVIAVERGRIVRDENRGVYGYAH
jgi:cell division transport system ATP-binding protein